MKVSKENLKRLIRQQMHVFANEKAQALPEEYWVNHVATTFVGTVRWWLENGRREDPETLSEYFFTVI